MNSTACYGADYLKAFYL